MHGKQPGARLRGRKRQGSRLRAGELASVVGLVRARTAGLDSTACLLGLALGRPSRPNVGLCWASTWAQKLGPEPLAHYWVLGLDQK